MVRIVKVTEKIKRKNHISTCWSCLVLGLWMSTVFACSELQVQQYYVGSLKSTIMRSFTLRNLANFTKQPCFFCNQMLSIYQYATIIMLVFCKCCVKTAAILITLKIKATSTKEPHSLSLALIMSSSN